MAWINILKFSGSAAVGSGNRIQVRIRIEVISCKN